MENNKNDINVSVSGFQALGLLAFILIPWCTVMPMIASGMKTGSAKGPCNRQDTQRCTSGRIGTDGNSVMISRTKRRKKHEHTQV